MDLVVNTYGVKIGCTGQRISLAFPNTKDKKEYSIRRLKKIILSGPASLTTSAIKLAMDHDVDIVCLGDFGKPIGRFISSRPRGLSQLRRAQLEIVTSPKSFALAKEMVKAKSTSQIDYLQFLGEKYSVDVVPEILQARQMVKKLDHISAETESREKLLGVEGYTADRYFAGLSKLFTFSGRKPGEKDPFNSCLNYGYGILYNEVERACLYIGLDPYLGLLHSERYGKPALVLDLVEEFRVAIVDMAIIPLFIERKIEESKHFEKISDQEYKLSTCGKALVIESIFAQLHQISVWRGKKYAFKAIIENQVRALGRYFLGKEKVYQTFNIHSLLKGNE